MAAPAQLKDMVKKGFPDKFKPIFIILIFQEDQINKVLKKYVNNN